MMTRMRCDASHDPFYHLQYQLPHPCPAAGSGPDLPLDFGNLVDAIDDEYTYVHDDGYDYGYESE